MMNTFMPPVSMASVTANPLVSAIFNGANDGLELCIASDRVAQEHLLAGGVLAVNVAKRIMDAQPPLIPSLLTPAIDLGEALGKGSKDFDVAGTILALQNVAGGFASRSLRTVFHPIAAAANTINTFFGSVDGGGLQELLTGDLKSLKAIRSAQIAVLIEEASGYNTASHELILRAHRNSDHFEISHFGRLLEKGLVDSVLAWVAHQLGVRNPDIILEEYLPILIGFAVEKGNTEVLLSILHSGNRAILIPNIFILQTEAKESLALTQFVNEMKRVMPEAFPAPKRRFLGLFS